MMRVVPYFVSFTILGVVLLGFELGGIWLLLAPVYIFAVLPLIDAFGGHDTENPPELDPKINRDVWQDLPLWLWGPAQLGATGYGLALVAQGGYSPLEFLGMIFSIGIMGVGAGINVGHELMHRSGKAERAMAEIMLTSVSYTHFCVEHILGHHRRVATPEDPASADLGDQVYVFAFKSMFGSVISAWKLEGVRVKRRDAGFMHLGDRRVRHPLMITAAYVISFAMAGWLGVLFFAAQSLTAVFLLEVINYIEHYGLRRKPTRNGNYERVQPHHSWNASQRVTNWFLYNLQRHSDHHYLARRPYWQLRHYEDVPQLPFGYATAILVALIPPLWWRIMDPRVEALRSRYDSALQGSGMDQASAVPAQDSRPRGRLAQEPQPQSIGALSP
jgi:alkane 1-monooxygenase